MQKPEVSNIDVLTLANNALPIVRGIRIHAKEVTLGKSYRLGNEPSPVSPRPATRISDDMHRALRAGCALTASLLDTARLDAEVIAAKTEYDQHLQAYAGAVQEVVSRIRKHEPEYRYSKLRDVMDRATDDEIRHVYLADKSATDAYEKLLEACRDKPVPLRVGDITADLSEASGQLFYLMALGEGARHMLDDTKVPPMVGKIMADTIGMAGGIWPRLKQDVLDRLPGETGGMALLAELDGRLAKPIATLRRSVESQPVFFSELAPSARKDHRALVDFVDALGVPAVQMQPHVTLLGRWARYMATHQQPVDGLPPRIR